MKNKKTRLRGAFLGEARHVLRVGGLDRFNSMTWTFSASRLHTASAVVASSK